MAEQSSSYRRWGAVDTKSFDASYSNGNQNLTTHHLVSKELFFAGSICNALHFSPYRDEEIEGPDADWSNLEEPYTSRA